MPHMFWLSHYVAVGIMALPSPAGESSHRAGKRRALYLEIVLAVYSEPMAEHVPGDDHVGFHSVHGQAVHAQELRQKGVAMALHYELERKAGRLRSVGRCQDRRGSPQAKMLPAWDSKLGYVKSRGSLDLQQEAVTPTLHWQNRARG